jgi:hypothetical protein
LAYFSVLFGAMAEEHSRSLGSKGLAKFEGEVKLPI